MSNEQKLMPLTIGPEQVALLERLSNAVAVSGDEGEVRSIVLEQVRPLVDEVRVDALGNVLARRKARQNASRALRVMVAAHMDEVGFMIVDTEENGNLRFEAVGGVDARQLPGKPVLVGREHIPGVIGARAIHLTTPEERRAAIPLDALRIDLGLEGKGKVKVGDRGTFATRFQQLGPSLVGKALDDRLGVTTLIELLRFAPGNIELCAAFTVQEEVGLRGARVAAYAFDPQVGIALDSTPANDLPTWDGSENTVYNARLGLGPAVYAADGRTLADPRLLRHLVSTAEALNIPYQIRQPGPGGTDAGEIHIQRAGIPSISVSTPHRHAHSAAQVARMSDWQATLALIYHSLARLQPELLEQER